MASEKNKGINEPNAIENLDSRLTGAGEKLVNNKKIVYWTLGGIVAVAVFVMSYFFIYKNPRTNNSWEAYNKVMLQQMKGEVTDSAAAVQYKKVADDYSGTDAAAVASLAASQAFYDEGKYDDAIKYLEKSNLSEPILASQAKVLLGDCYVNKGDKFYSKAIDAYQTAIKKADSNPQIVPAVLIKEANVYDAQKNYAKALECYEQIKTGYPKFRFGNGMSIDGYIAREKARLGK
ncbi:MAG: tetratricopeptide repeat protein [Muribaculaceae bacterium]|nr:tetratricopeptide repeat protein [Muribaculaceae bacterium]